MVTQATEFVCRRWRLSRGAVRVELQPLQGGLESAVALARVSATDADGAAVPQPFVVKRLPTGFEREAEIYELLWRHLDPPPAVRMLGRSGTRQASYLYLENARPSADWPWADTQRAGAVCRALASLHDSEALPRERFSWDYEAELATSARATLEMAETARGMSGRRCWARVGDLRRVVAALPRIRQRLLSAETTVIHGDMHPGNVILRDGGAPEVALIDWARARIGSPLEDIASWLHALGCWEPEARRRHDTLMRIYLTARRVRLRFTGGIRSDYWLASASNGLSGAIRYHLAVLSDAHASEAARYDASRALTAWQRVIRGAAALIGTSPEWGRARTLHGAAADRRVR